MTLPDDLFAVPPDPARPERPPRKCRRHEWVTHDFEASESGGILPAGTVHCLRCPAIRDDATARRGRNNRKRGGAAELDVARSLNGGRKMGPLGLPWDVEVEGYLRLQVKKLAKWPSLTLVQTWLDAIPPSAAMRGVALVQPGRRPRRLIVLDLDEFARWHGDPLNKMPDE